MNMADYFDLLMNGIAIKFTTVLRESTHTSSKFYCILGMEIAQFLFLMNNNNKDYLIKIDEDSNQELNLNWFNNSQKFSNGPVCVKK